MNAHQAVSHYNREQLGNCQAVSDLSINQISIF